MEQSQNMWRPCSVCKKPIAQKTEYYVCSVSTCNSQRTGYVFCSMTCFERHLPEARHRDAGAVEKTAPAIAYQSVPATNTGSSGGVRRIVSANPAAHSQVPSSSKSQFQSANSATTASASTQSSNDDVLVIASRLKEYIAARADYNTSGGVMRVLSNHLRIICNRAIDNARADGRKTVMEKDFDFLR